MDRVRDGRGDGQGLLLRGRGPPPEIPPGLAARRSTGERIAFEQANADFVYQSPVPFQLEIDTHIRTGPISPNTDTFFKYEDERQVESQIFAFSDRNSNGDNPGAAGRGDYPALSHNAMTPHSIRGQVDSRNEGPRYCVACHLIDEALTNHGAEYSAFRTAMANDDFASLDFDLLKIHIGENSGNQKNSPLWVHMVSGLGSGLFLFDASGCPVNSLDSDDQRFGCNSLSPQDRFPARLGTVAYNLDRLVEDSGVSNCSNNHALLEQGQGPNQRDGALNPNLAGPLGRRADTPSLGSRHRRGARFLARCGCTARRRRIAFRRALRRPG